jgi:hypothetical protein
LLVFAQAVSLIVTAIGALLGTVKEFRHEGRVTNVGRVAAVLIVIGLASNAVTLVLQEQNSKASEKRSQENQLRLEVQNRQQRIQLIQQRAELFQQSPVRRLAVWVAWSEDTKALPGFAVLTRVESRNGDYIFVIPTQASSKEGPFRPAAMRSVSEGWKSVPGASVSFIDTLLTTISLKEGDVPSSDWTMKVRGDLVKVHHSVVIPATSERPDAQALRRALAAIKDVFMLFDNVPVHRVPKASFGPDLLLSTSTGGDFVSQGRYQQAKFYMGAPDWMAIAAAAKPEQVAAPNRLFEVFKTFKSEGQDLTLQPSG